VVATSSTRVAWLSREQPDLAEARAAADRATQGATKASEVIARIRTLITKATPEKSPVQFNQVIKETSALAAGQASRNDVAIEFDLSPDLPYVLGDSIQFQQVVLNLLMNGIEAMSNVTGRPRKLVLRTETLSSGQIRVSVKDLGVGVNADVMPRLFEPFFTTRAKGMGMGLPISRSIIEAHGGRLWAESDSSGGAIFQFTLPSQDGLAT
jgi:C4-dicarboxylate-specific signal transduction histidine kinase